tara:strand:+ start:888 stop:1670 length:783 start_codon:yes stop_codon:yes gene_type:complete
MTFPKKSLGQNFLIEKNIVKKILNLTNLKGKNVIEIGPGKGALTTEILKKKPKSFTLIEKDYELVKFLNSKFINNKVKIISADVLKFDFDNLKEDKLIIIGNLPYNISSQILIKILKYNNIEKKISNLIFMFQKELGEKIIGKFPSKNYGRLSIIANYKLKFIEKFLVSSNCFFPKPKVTSIVIHFKILKKKFFDIKNISNLEKITNMLFSNKRKMINKRIRKILNNEKIKKIPELNLNLRPERISPNIFYKITELYEKN